MKKPAALLTLALATCAIGAWGCATTDAARSDDESGGAYESSSSKIAREEKEKLERGRRHEARRPPQGEPAMQLPPGVAEERRAVRVQRVTRALALRPVARVVQPHHSEWAGHANQRAEPDHEAGHRPRRREAAVDEMPV